MRFVVLGRGKIAESFLKLYFEGEFHKHDLVGLVATNNCFSIFKDNLI